MPLNTIKIFLASSSELTADREEFRQFISVQNDRLVHQNTFLQIVQWEYFLDSISDTRLQNEYNKALRECDFVLCLFFTKVGKYTAEEFETAYQIFKETGKPLIWTYFKDAPINAGMITEEIAGLLSFKKKLNDLGHFHTVYTNTDNLINQFRNQLDKVLPVIAAEKEDKQTPVEVAGPSTSSEAAKIRFNEKLTRRLIEALQTSSSRAKKFLDNANRMASDWETQARFSDPAKEIIAFSFVGILGIQLRKLMAIGKEDFSANKMKKYLENCQLTCKRALQLLCFSLLSRLWDYKKENNLLFTPEQATTCKNFFEDEFEWDIGGFADLLKTLVSIFTNNRLALPITELNESKRIFDSQSNFVAACEKIGAIGKLLEASSFTVDDCLAAEINLTTVLESLSFLANYRMVSIKRIDYFEMRNSKPHYLYNYTALGVDSKSNINQERVNYAEAPINTDAVLLYRGTYQQNVNLFPFVIDVNALALEGGAKICFYACNDNSDGSLIYSFLEDNSLVNIANTETLRPGVDINEVLMDFKKRRDMRFDSVFTLFQEAKKTLTGVEEEVDDFSNPF